MAQAIDEPPARSAVGQSSSSSTTIVPQHAPYVEPFVLVAASTSSIVARLFTHPLDTMRIRIQTWPGSTLPALRELVPRPRVRTLYAGLPVAITFGVPALSVYLTTYEASKRYLGFHLLPKDHKPTLLQQLPLFMLSGFLAEIASGAIWTPMDVMKARLQKGSDGPITAVQLLRKIWRTEGYRGVWRGYWLSNAIFIPYISLYWAMYESFKTRFIASYDAYNPPSPSAAQGPIPLTLQYVLCSVSSCALAVCVTNPIELVQARWQTSAGLHRGGVGAIARELWQQGGVKAFGRGLSMKVAYAIPANAISMGIYEQMKLWKGI